MVPTRKKQDESNDVQIEIEKQCTRHYSVAFLCIYCVGAVAVFEGEEWANVRFSLSSSSIVPATLRCVHGCTTRTNYQYDTF